MKFTVTDEPSKSANPRRGYHARICTVRFEPSAPVGPLDEDAQRRWVTGIAEMFKDDMWCQIKKYEPDVWTIHHGYDSGD